MIHIWDDFKMLKRNESHFKWTEQILAKSFL